MQEGNQWRFVCFFLFLSHCCYCSSSRWLVSQKVILHRLNNGRCAGKAEGKACTSKGIQKMLFRVSGSPWPDLLLDGRPRRTMAVNASGSIGGNYKIAILLHLHLSSSFTSSRPTCLDGKYVLSRALPCLGLE